MTHGMDFRLIVLLVLVTVIAGPAYPYGGGGSDAPSTSTASVPGSKIETRPPEPPVMKNLAEAATKETDPDVRATAAVSMGQFPQSVMAAATLATLAKDPAQGQQVRSAAAVSLGNHGGPENAAPLTGLLRDADPIVRRHAVLGMGLLQSPTVIDSLANSLGDGDDGVRRAAARALAFSGSAGARSALEAAARTDANPLVRLESVRTLVQTNGATPELLQQLARSDADAEVRALCTAAAAGLILQSARASAATTATTAPAPGAALTQVGPSGAALDSAIRGAGALAATAEQRVAISPLPGSVSATGATTTVQTRRRVKLARSDDDEELTDYSAEASSGHDEPEAGAAKPPAAPSAAPSPLAPVAPAGVTALSSTTALPRTTDTANGESGRAHPGEPIAAAISRLAARLAPGAAPADEQLRTMHELAPLIDQAAFQGSKVVPLSPAKGRWFLTAHRKISEHEPLVKSTFVNEQGAMFRAESKQQHMPGSTYVVFRFKDVGGQPGALNGIGAYTYTRAGIPVFKHFALDGKLDEFSSPKVNAETCFRCHDNKESLNHAKDFTFDTFQKAKANGTVELMEQARTKVVSE